MRALSMAWPLLAFLAQQASSQPTLQSASPYEPASAARNGAAPPRRPQPRFAGRDAEQAQKKHLNLDQDPNDPHSKGFEPREHKDRWTFGRAHAALHHVLDEAVFGDAASVATTLDAFSADHGLSYGIGAERAFALDRSIRLAAGMATLGDVAGGATSKQGPFLEAHAPAGAGGNSSGLAVLVLDSGFGGVTIRCLQPLLQVVADTPHEVVSVEPESHFSDGVHRMVTHALGEAGTDLIRHTPLMPGEDTTLGEVVESVFDSHELKHFNVVMLGGRDRDRHGEQLQELLKSGALKEGSIVHAPGPGRDDASTARYMKLLHGASFATEVHDEDGGAAVVASLRTSHDDEL